MQMIEFSKPTPKRRGLQATIADLPLGQLMVVWMSDYTRNSVSNAASLAGRRRHSSGKTGSPSTCPEPAPRW